MSKAISYFLVIFIFVFLNYTQAQKLEPSANFKNSLILIEGKLYNTESYDNTLALSNKLVNSAKNNFEKGMALYTKANVIICGSADINSGELALPYALESAKILSLEKNDSLYRYALSIISNCYLAKYIVNKHDGGRNKGAIYYANLALIVQFNPNFRPETEKYLPLKNYQDANDNELNDYLKNLQKSLEIYVKRKDYTQIMYKNQTLGRMIWYSQLKFEIAEPYLKTAILYADSAKNKDFKYVIYNSLLSIGLESKNYDKAIYYGELNLNNIVKEKNETREGNIENMLYLAYKGKGNYKEAYKHKDRAIEITDKYHRQTEIGRSKLLKERNANLETQVALQTELKRQQDIRLYLGLIIAALIIAFGAVLFYNRNLVLKNKAISEAKFQGQSIERKRVALDLHDNLGSTISSLKWTLESVNVEKLMPKDKAKIKDLEKMIDVAYAEVRLLSHNLLPEELQKQGLRKALLVLTSKLNSLNKIKFELDYPDHIEAFSPQVAFEIYSVCLELINNIQKHSEATQAAIKFVKTGADLKIIITDNGIGISDDTKLGHGLQNIEDRLKAINASFEYLAILPTGTKSTITLK
jgi:signal transduction histidine kinase